MELNEYNLYFKGLKVTALGTRPGNSKP